MWLRIIRSEIHFLLLLIYVIFYLFPEVINIWSGWQLWRLVRWRLVLARCLLAVLALRNGIKDLLVLLKIIDLNTILNVHLLLLLIRHLLV